jgi:DNA-binding LytR/AlgR family response regulator
MSLVNLSVLEKQIHSDELLRVHRSYIVNLNRITSIEHSRIIIEDKADIPVSGQYKELFLKYINSHSLG